MRTTLHRIGPDRSLLAAVPDRAGVEALARDHEVIPVYADMLADQVTPVTLFAQLTGADEPAFLLESVAVTGGVGRYSYIGYRPRLLAPAEGDPLDPLRALADHRIAPVPGLPPFVGGAVGYLGYECARHFERLPAAAGAAPPLPESAFLLVEDLVVVDHATRRLLLLTLHRPARESYDDALERIAAMRRRIDAPPASRADDGARPARYGAGTAAAPVADGEGELAGWRSNVGQAEFEARVRRAKEHIAAGDAFQIVLSQRFSRPLRAAPFDLYRQLRTVNPSPYMYHLSLGDGRYVIGASPELLVKAEGRRVETRPLAGTRHRGADLSTDLALEQELLADEKECAEHIMLVDLGRHDLGRVTTPGTVRVERLLEVERFSHVMHLSSTVAGRLTDEATALDALRSAFPAGTLTGAPKIRAMEIIASLEADRRGVYGGALGFVGYGGTADLAIALRTIVVGDGQVHVQAGAGVVADSDPTAEYRETLHKARAMFTAVRRAEEMA